MIDKNINRRDFNKQVGTVAIVGLTGLSVSAKEKAKVKAVANELPAGLKKASSKEGIGAGLNYVEVAGDPKKECYKCNLYACKKVVNKDWAPCNVMPNTYVHKGASCKLFSANKNHCKPS